MARRLRCSAHICVAWSRLFPPSSQARLSFHQTQALLAWYLHLYHFPLGTSCLVCCFACFVRSSTCTFFVPCSLPHWNAVSERRDTLNQHKRKACADPDNKAAEMGCRESASCNRQKHADRQDKSHKGKCRPNTERARQARMKAVKST